jgi:hypothetical protein
MERRTCVNRGPLMDLRIANTNGRTFMSYCRMGDRARSWSLHA